MLGYCILASLSVDIQFLFVTTLPVHLIYALFRSQAEKRISIKALSAVTVLMGLLLTPWALFMRFLFKTSSSHSFAGTPTITDLLALLAPPVAVGSILTVLFLAYLANQHLNFSVPQIERASLVLLATLALAPLAILYGISVMTSVKVFIPRYTLPSAAGLALIAGWTLSGISPARLRLAAVGAVVLATFMSAPGIQFAHGGDWRAATAKVRSIVGSSNTLVLVRSDFPESEPFDWLNNEIRRSYLFAPLTVYPIGGVVLGLPVHLNAESIAYLNEVMPRLEQSDSFVFVNMGDSSYENWLLGRLSTEGFERHRSGSFGGSLTVDTYSRSVATGQPVRNTR
jgi:hypothetical protein